MLKIDFIASGATSTSTSTQPPLDASPASSSRLPDQTSLPISQQPSSSGLTAGAKAGISVGAILGALILITAPLFLYRRHLQKETRKLDNAAEDGMSGTIEPEIAEMRGDDEQEKKPNELHAQHRISELQSPVVELDGGAVVTSVPADHSVSEGNTGRSRS
jgi:hypothetical protein